jgi:peptide/nickel transport system permease protein
LGLYSAARTARLVRSGMLKALTEEYARTARAKGLASRIVVLRHTLRNALIPVVTVIGLDLATLLGGAVITETIFGWPGVGRHAGGQRAHDHQLPPSGRAESGNELHKSL